MPTSTSLSVCLSLVINARHVFLNNSIDPDFMDWKCHFDATNQFSKIKWDNCKNIKHTMFWNISIKVQNKIETQIRIKIAVEVQRPQLRNLLWNLVLSMPYLHIYFDRMEWWNHYTHWQIHTAGSHLFEWTLGR